MGRSDIKLVSVTDDDIQVLGAARLGVGVMGVQKEVVFTVVNDTIKFAGSLLFGTNLFQEFLLLFDFKGGNVLMIEKEEDIYDHTVMPLVNLKGDVKGQTSRKSYGIKRPREEDVDTSDEDESFTDDSDTEETDYEEIVSEKKRFFLH